MARGSSFKQSHRSRKNYGFFGLLAVGIACLLTGIYRGEVYTVLSKAITICLQCIGIG